MQERHRAGWIASTVVALFISLWPGSSRALTDEEVFRTFRFNFVNPGGRALAMGGAFIGIADDATAAAANPAGLTNLISPELFSELRLQDTSESLLNATVGDPRGGTAPVLTESSASPDNIFHPSFVSFVLPFDNWVIGLSRQEVLRQDVDTVNLFTDKPAFPTTEIVRADGSVKTLLEYYNLSFGFRGGDKFAGGVNLTYAHLDVESRTASQLNVGSGLQNDFATSIDDSQNDFAYSIGVLYKPVDVFHVGAVYREGPEFTLEEMIEDTRPTGNFPSAGVLADFLGNRNYAFDGSAPFGIAPSTFDDPLQFENSFKIPTQYGIGFGFRPSSSWTIALDIVHIEYSDLTEDFVGNVNALTFPGDPPDCDFTSPKGDGTFPCDYTTPRARYEFDDETIFRLGAEYVFTINETIPFAVRAGIWNDPNVRLEADFNGDVFIASEDTFPSGDDQVHYTFGLGFVLQEKFQADFAVDISDNDDVFITSLIYHF